MLRIKEKYDKDNYYFSYITEYISNALNFSSINLTSYIELRKTLTNIETLLIECKGKFGVQIMIERTKYLIKEKVKKLKEKLISEKFNLSQEMIKNELEKAKNDKKNLIEKLKIEKEKLKTIKSEKINSLKKSKKSTNRNFYSPDVVSLHAQERISNASNNLLCQNFEIEESSKDEYKDFVKVVLKTKFEKIKSDHPGQKIPDKILFLECQKQKIQRIDYEMFIVSELNKFEKYSKYIFRRSGKLANKVNNLINNQAPRVTNFKVKPLNDMDIINEESFN